MKIKESTRDFMILNAKIRLCIFYVQFKNIAILPGEKKRLAFGNLMLPEYINNDILQYLIE